MLTFHARCICGYIKIFKTDPFSMKWFILRLNFFTASTIFNKFPQPKKLILWIVDRTPFIKLTSICVSIERHVQEFNQSCNSETIKVLGSVTERQLSHHFHVVPSLLIAKKWHNVWERVTTNQKITSKSRVQVFANYKDTCENFIGGRDDETGTVIFKMHLHRKNTYQRK